jgi:hypothetical protein
MVTTEVLINTGDFLELQATFIRWLANYADAAVMARSLTGALARC